MTSNKAVSAFTAKWIPDELWDIHTPQNTYSVEFSLLEDAGNVLDTTPPERFGFREFWIDGRDFFSMVAVSSSAPFRWTTRRSALRSPVTTPPARAWSASKAFGNQLRIYSQLRLPARFASWIFRNAEGGRRRRRIGVP
jgi:hypothetical protein